MICSRWRPNPRYLQGFRASTSSNKERYALDAVVWYQETVSAGLTLYLCSRGLLGLCHVVCPEGYARFMSCCWSLVLELMAAATPVMLLEIACHSHQWGSVADVCTQVQTLEPTEASMLLSGRPAAQTEQQDQEPHLQLQIQVDEDQQSLSVALKLTQQPTATSVSDNKPAGAAAAKGPSTSSVSRLPGRRLGFGTGLGNNKPAAAGAGDNSISALLGGAWAQGSAAAGVTELVEKPKKKGPAKRVMWRPDRDLVAVRWFVKDDAPAKVNAVCSAAAAC